MDTSLISQKIESAIPVSTARVQSEDGVHFQVVVTSDSFEGVSRVKRQQMVYAAVNEHILDESLHAIALKTYTQQEWEGQNKT